jgi:YHS domain-containing protein
MQIQTTDPVNGEKVTDIYAPFVVERNGEDARKIYFTSDENKQIYLYIENLQQKHL